MDLNKVSKQFCENIIVGYTPESFVLAMLVGESGTAYALTPQHMKRLSQYLVDQVQEYEKKYQPIEAKWPPDVESPIQTTDLKGGTK
ncbi:MAG TPA: hypothetical protein ENI56_02015 [Candidatus Kaiserbacteria bacterium]|nr:hypothetical protein [Candidatus Kaiserbacteria bacterium]